jgi:hypothetical protein
MINKVTVTTFKADITVGLKQGYSDAVWGLNELKISLVKAQKLLKESKDILLSAKVTLCDIVFLGQDEPSVTISFINYPKFPIEREVFKGGIEFIARILLDDLKQNRIVIVFGDKTLMLEKSDEIDSNIDLD